MREFYILQLRKHLKKLSRQLFITVSGVHELFVDSIIEVISNCAASAPGDTVIFRQSEVMEHIDVISQGMT